MYHREQLLNKRCFIAWMLAQNTIMACVSQRKKSVIASSSCLCAPLSSSVILCTDVFVCVRSNCVRCVRMGVCACLAGDAAEAFTAGSCST